MVSVSKVWVQTAILVLVTFAFIPVETREKGNITFYDANFQKGTKVRVEASTRCASIPESIAGKVKSIDTEGSCIYLWDQPKCQGRHLKLYRYTNAGNRIEGIVPMSFQICGNELTRSITLFMNKNFAGNSKKIYVPGDGECLNITSDFVNKLGSVRPVRPEYCFVIWEGKDCKAGTRRGIRIGKEFPIAKDLVSTGWNTRLASIQDCSAVDRDCQGKNKDTDVVKPKPKPKPTDEEL